MGPLPYGPVTRHINTSNGTESDKTQFYLTEYSKSHGKSGYQPRHGKHVGTGYQSNFRPGLFYSKRMDEIDNPKLGEMLTENYSSMNSFDFRKSLGAKGHESLPHQIHIVKSAFVKDRPQTLPCEKQVLSAGYDPKNISVRSTTKPPRSMLYLQTNKDPIEKENAYHGPARMSIESRTRFVKHPVKNNDDHLLNAIGPKTGSGFTHSINNEPITFQNDFCYDGNSQPQSRVVGGDCGGGTGVSFMRNAFQPMLSANGKEECKLLSKRAATQNGYTRSMKPRAEYALNRLDTYTRADDLQPFQVEKLKKNNKGEYFDVLYSAPFPSMTTASFPRHHHVQLLGNNYNKNGSQTVEGRKQDTGFTENNCKFVQSAKTDESLSRFETHYKLRYYDKNPRLVSDAFARFQNNVSKQQENGFVKSTRVQTMGNPASKQPSGNHHTYVDTATTIHPYVKRSLRARDPSYTARCAN